MYGTFRQKLQDTLREIDEAGLTKPERVIVTPQGSAIRVQDGREVINFCANNYLGLANDPRIVAAAHAGLDTWGYGLSSVRFICGTQGVHKQLEGAIAQFFGAEDTILYSSCFDANGGVFETLLGEEDAVISDALNHASIIDGIRLCKAERYRYEHGNLADLERCLQQSQAQRFRLVVTDGVFSMDGDVADLAAIADLCDRYEALLMVDESHSTGFFGPGGRGVPAYHGVQHRVDLITSTLGKALGGASGGFVTGRAEIIALLRQRSRPYLFSNTLAPAIAAASIEALRLIDNADGLRAQLEANTRRFREGMTAAGFTLRAGIHPIVPVMLGDAKVAQEFARRLLDEGIYVIGFSFPVVPKGQARIRVQLSAAHTPAQVEAAIAAFTRVGQQLGVVS
jgi:glycine C-acetyltransferase